MLQSPEISIVLPVLNEEESIEDCLKEVIEILKNLGTTYEVIIVDNGSTDGTREKILNLKGILKNTKLVSHPIRGYGSAYLKGIDVAKGKYIFMADADGSYEFKEIPRFLNELKKGYEFVIGNRFKGKMESSAMPLSHRYIGNPLLSGILKIFFRTGVGDSHCGMRAIKKSSLDRLELKTKGMEFASEMVIKAVKNNLRIKELAIDYRKRKGYSKLKSVSDGWRHLRFMLLYAPLFLFFMPGIFLFLLGLISMASFYFISVQISMIQFYYHPMFISSIFMLIGYQIISFSLFAKTYAINHLGEKPQFRKLYGYLTLERVAIGALVTIILSLALFGKVILGWLWFEFNALQATKDSIVALTLLMLGVQTFFSAFMLSILGIQDK